MVLSVPKPIPALDGAHYKTYDGVTVSLLSWLNGTPWSQLSTTVEMYYQLGRELAKMHTLTDAWEMPAAFKRPTWDLAGDNPTWDRFWENPLLSQAQAEHLLSFRELAENTLKRLEPLDIGLIHADLVPDNVLTDGETLRLIDFDDSGFGHRLFDLATITRRSRFIQSDGLLAEAAIEGYAADRQTDRDALMLFEALRACTYIGWNISRMNEAGGIERNARYISEAETAIEHFMRTIQ